ncbi:hypothetical protein PY092_01145 [Muricauda sp. 334s03]|uniref:Uncharacterized protein n=1 Tax=Flagellimonas yonaguniensis TaxID=3031325 RepID=A0ABT5XU77_9FLAO|nr:hypothetical protein [[Muricauda] yonaguniensis]MDF0714739.1 hypothetical protein [[Muricauda] yonaguniensis]
MKRLKNLLFVMLLTPLGWNCQKEEAHNLEPIQETADKNVQIMALTIDVLSIG